MIHERYYSYIKNYRRDDGKAFMENAYNEGKGEKVDGEDVNAANWENMSQVKTPSTSVSKELKMY